MTAPGIFRPPTPVNEAIRSYAPGSAERESLQARLESMQRERLEIPCVIGGREVRTGRLRPAVMPHRKEHVLADVHQGGAAEVELAVAAAREGWQEWSRTPWEDRVAVLLRAAELLSGPWRDTLNAATMLGQSKTAHQAEIDAACESIDFFRFNASYLVRIYEEQPTSSPGVWNRLEYRPLEGFVFAISPFNFTAIGANLTTSPVLMGCTVVWKPASTAMLSAYYTMKLLEEAGLPPGVINLVYGSGAEIGAPALASPDLAGVHFTGSTSVFQGIWREIGGGIERYRNYPRIVGETGGKDFVLAHPSADVDEVATAILRGAFEYQGQKCSAASRVYAPSNLWPALRQRLAERNGHDQDRRRRGLHQLHGCRHRRELTQHPAGCNRGGANRSRLGDRGRGIGRRLGRLLRATDDHRDPRSGIPSPSRRAVRPGSHVLRVPGERLRGYARPRRPDRSLRPDGGGLLRRSVRAQARIGEAPVRGRERLPERQAHGSGRRATAVRRIQGIRNERQGGIDVEPDPLGLTPHDQGDVRPADRLSLPVSRGRARTPVSHARPVLCSAA